MLRIWLFTLMMQESNSKDLLDIVKEFIKMVDYKINIPNHLFFYLPVMISLKTKWGKKSQLQ